MRNRKAASPNPRNEPEGNLAASLATLISHQMEVGLEAVRCGRNDLAALVACQLFDALDWARMNLAMESPATVDMHILAHLKGATARFRSLQELEDYAETHLSTMSEHM